MNEISTPAEKYFSGSEWLFRLCRAAFEDDGYPLDGLLVLDRDPHRRHLDGPKLARWLWSHYGDLSNQLGHDLRRVREWEGGSRAEVGTADRILIRLGGHLCMLPADLWLERSIRQRASESSSPAEISNAPETTRKKAA